MSGAVRTGSGCSVGWVWGVWVGPPVFEAPQHTSVPPVRAGRGPGAFPRYLGAAVVVRRGPALRAP